ncbi:SDR family NAD(P)-dependent oxidoreductase [Pelagibius sp. Alg239-R121]|uniref:SDR family NAD(P)-dependent oxidoreductase n=1 Tax=Pelagibius sp. Alg239-R121 TaxID=2993448 RepID=UPI0024A66BDD|nr:SDR family oxidoreductase [Pelagibius sp. Alg239-R121]
MMLEGKTAVITGAARGIGLACAERFVKEGAKVVLADVMDDAGEAAAQGLSESGGVARYRPCDVTDKMQVDDLIAFAQETFGRLDCVIANAGIVHNSDILDLEEADFDRVIAVNLKGVFLTGQAAARVMRDQAPDAEGCRGTIINMSSLNAVVAIPAIAPYVIAKGGVNQWTKCLGIRMAPEGVRVNAIGPGSINTEMFQTVADDPQKMHAVLSRTPMERPGEPDEIAKVAVFLASHYSSYMTGQTVYPDGGRMGLNYVVPVKDPGT